MRSRQRLVRRLRPDLAAGALLLLGLTTCTAPVSGGSSEGTGDAAMHDAANADSGADAAGADAVWTDPCLKPLFPMKVSGTACTFELPEPTERDQRREHVDVLLDGDPLPLDESNGWRYGDPKMLTIVLTGEACEGYLANPDAVVSIYYRCILI